MKKLEILASKRKLDDLTLGPILTVTNDTFLKHVDSLLAIPGTELLFGGQILPSTSHKIPSCYGSFSPTAIKIPIERFISPEYYHLCTTEIFGPFQVVISYTTEQLPLLLTALDKTHAYLTAAVVSNDVQFQRKVLASTINGTTYCGLRARTTG